MKRMTTQCLLMILLPAILLFACNNKHDKPVKAKTTVSVSDTIPFPKDSGNAFRELRQLALDMTPEKMQFNISKDKIEVYGVIMDWSVEEDMFTIACFISGDASFYSSGGGGFIGGIAIPDIKIAAKDLVKTAQDYIDEAIQANGTSFPPRHYMRFYLLTNKGRYTMEDRFDNVDRGKSFLNDIAGKADKLLEYISRELEKQDTDSL